MTNHDAHAKIGIAPDSWGVWNPQDDKQPEPTQYLREVAEAGYHWTELGPYGYLGTDAEKLREQFADHDLSLTAGTVFTALHRSPEAVDTAWEEVHQVASLVQALGAQHVITLPVLWSRNESGQVIGDRSFSSEEWNNFCTGHNEIGRRLLDEFGLKQQFHSHAESQIGSYNEVIRLLENTNPEFVNLCLDTGHFAYYLGDNDRLIQEHPNRIGYLHLKQVEPDFLADVLKNDISFEEAVARGIMVEPPLGVPAYGSILTEAVAQNHGIFAVVEQDMYPLRDFSEPKKIAERTREYIANCGAPVRFR